MIDYYVVMVGDKPLVIYGEKPSVSSADMPRPIQLAEDDIVRVRYDAKAMRFLPNRPSRITYPKAKTLKRGSAPLSPQLNNTAENTWRS